MKWFYNMKIGAKLIMAFVIVAFIAGIVGTVGIVEITKIDKDYNALYEGYGVPLGYLTKITEGHQKRRGLLKDLIIQSNPSDEQKTVEKIKAVEKVILDNMKLYEATIINEEDSKTFKELTTLLEKYEPVKEGFITNALAQRDAEALAAMTGEGAMVTQNLEEKIDAIIKLNVDTGRALSLQYTKTTKGMIGIMISTILVGMAIAIGMGLYISRLISRPIASLVGAANKIAEGDLDAVIEVHSKDEIGVLAHAFRKMADNLNDVMSNISIAAEQVASGSRQVSESSMALSEGATEQASSVEQLTASLEEISSQTRQNADSASEANKLAEVAKSNAVQGNNQMKEMLKAMEDINEASGNISKIIKVIDEIAFQTNILALNAAVEAARAGQHGKGFAVVAEEVRNLAARSANAAKETTAMIEGSIKKVEGGTKIANETADALNMIVGGVAKVASLVSDIATASNEQASGIAQINQGIMQVSEVIQANSATSEESAAASEELSSQAELLKEQVSKFKLRRLSSTLGSHKGIETISPDILHMLEQMKNKNKTIVQKEGSGEISKKGTKKIILSDSEFGKY